MKALFGSRPGPRVWLDLTSEDSPVANEVFTSVEL